jgi:hypothetical protein
MTDNRTLEELLGHVDPDEPIVQPPAELDDAKVKALLEELSHYHSRFRRTNPRSRKRRMMMIGESRMMTRTGKKRQRRWTMSSPASVTKLKSNQPSPPPMGTTGKTPTKPKSHGNHQRRTADRPLRLLQTLTCPLSPKISPVPIPQRHPLPIPRMISLPVFPPYADLQLPRLSASHPYLPPSLPRNPNNLHPGPTTQMAI